MTHESFGVASPEQRKQGLFLMGNQGRVVASIGRRIALRSRDGIGLEDWHAHGTRCIVQLRRDELRTKGCEGVATAELVCIDGLCLTAACRANPSHARRPPSSLRCGKTSLILLIQLRIADPIRLREDDLDPGPKRFTIGSSVLEYPRSESGQSHKVSAGRLWVAMKLGSR